GAISGVPLTKALPPPDAPKTVVMAGSHRDIELDIPDRDKLAEIHPLLGTQGSFPLHRFGAGSEFTKWKAGIFPERETEIERDNRDLFRRSFRMIGQSHVTFIESKRNPPPLFGAGLIDGIPDRVLQEAAAEQAKASQKVRTDGSADQDFSRAIQFMK